MYIVLLVKPPTQDDFRSDYFPRKVRYRRDAQELVEEVKRKGGEARIVRSND